MMAQQRDGVRRRDGSKDSLDYFWEEIKDIEKEEDTGEDPADEEPPKTPDGKSTSSSHRPPMVGTRGHLLYPVYMEQNC